MGTLTSRRSRSKKEVILNQKDKIEEFANIHGISTMPFDIKELVEKSGFKLLYEEFSDKDISGYIEKRAGQYYISVNKYHNINRQRFTIAHELGHYLLHRDKLDSFNEEEIFFRNERLDDEELEANNFASELLMPEVEYRKIVSKGKKKFRDIADHFQVSIAAARYRAYKLNMIGRY